jgi:colicin import membrane protein
MADNGAQALEGTEEKAENAPRPTEEKKAETAPEAAAAESASSSEAQSSGPAPASDQETIRSVFVARTTAAIAASVAGFARMETTNDGLAVRGAYCARLAVVEAEVVSGAPAAESDVLRKAYLARAVADMAVQPRAPKRGAASKPTKASAAKAKARAARAAAAKPKKLGAASAKAKPRAATRRAAARPAGRGKRRGR